MYTAPLKFRAWGRNIHSVEKPYTMAYFSIETILERNLSSITDEDDDLIMLRFIESEIMQSTGLKDKNNVEIFGGDIVKCWLWKTPEVVKDFPHFYYQHIEYGYQELEIIGNVFENPELKPK